MSDLPPPERFMEAMEDYYEALDEPMDESTRAAITESMPEDPVVLAQMSYYLEQMTPEIDRLHKGLEGHAMEGGTEFDQSAWQQLTESLPRTPEDLAEMSEQELSVMNLGAGGYDQQLGARDFDSVRESLEGVTPTPGTVGLQAYMLEQELDPAILDAVQEMDKAAQIAEYKADFAEWNPEQAAVETAAAPTEHDVVAEGAFEVGKDLGGMFMKADAHEGEASLETMHMEQQQVALETSDPVVSNAQTLGG